MKVGLLKGDYSPLDIVGEKIFDNGAFIRVSFSDTACFMEIFKTFKSKEPERLSIFSFDFDGENRNETVILHTDYMQVELNCLPIKDLFDEAKEYSEYSIPPEDGISVIDRDRVVYVSGDKRVLRLAVVNIASGQSVVGDIKFLKSLRFQQGKSVQEGKYSDAFLTRTIGIPKATLSRWKTDKGWRKNVYDLINEMDFSSDREQS